MMGMAIKPRGLDKVIARIERARQTIADAAVKALEQQLQLTVLYIVSDKLSGQVLNRVTGDLQNSIGFEINQASGFPIRGTVFSRGVAYAYAHEYGFDGMQNVSEQVRTMVFGRTVAPFTVPAFTRHLVLPERSFIRTGISDRLVDIKSAIRSAVVGVLVA